LSWPENVAVKVPQSKLPENGSLNWNVSEVPRQIRLL